MPRRKGVETSKKTVFANDTTDKIVGGTTTRHNEGAVEVARVSSRLKTADSRAKVTVGKPRRVISGTSMRSKYAFPSTSSGSQGSGGNFYSPEMSTDFLELPQSLDEQRNYFRFFYK